MVKMENMVKIEKILFNCFNNYHSNIKRTVALNRDSDKRDKRAIKEIIE